MLGREGVESHHVEALLLIARWATIITTGKKVNQSPTAQNGAL